MFEISCGSDVPIRVTTAHGIYIRRGGKCEFVTLTTERLSPNCREGFAFAYFFNSASAPACAIVLSISDFAPLAEIPPSVCPSTIIGTPL
jgi:hypothetical protein